MEQGRYLGCVSEADAHCFQKDQKLDDCRYSIENFFVRWDLNWLGVMEAFASNDTNIMPVLDEKMTYLGYYELQDVMHEFNDTPFMAEPGTTIIVEKGFTDYSFSEVAQIVEGNGAKLYGAFISKNENDLAQITIKMSQGGLSEILATFRRYSYNIITSSLDDEYLQSLRDRSEYFDRYLSMGS